MTTLFPTRREMKRRAKDYMFHPICMRLTLILVCAQMAAQGLRFLFNGMLSYYLADLSKYGDSVSGIFFNPEGFSILLRMDVYNLVLAIPVTYSQLALFLILNTVFFFVVAPFRLGAVEGYWKVFRGQEHNVKAVFKWFSEGRRFGKAIAVEAILRIGVRAVGFLATIPGIYLYYRYFQVATVENTSMGIELLQLGASVIFILAALLAFAIHCFFLPVRYCLAAHPEYTIGETFRKGLLSTKGFRGMFFNFRISYFLWFICSQITYGVLDLYVMPYTTLGSMVFIQECAKRKELPANIEKPEEL